MTLNSNNKLTLELRSSGVEELSLNYVVALTGSVPGINNYSPQSNVIRSNSTITYEKIDSIFYTGGKSYKIMRITATPKGQEGLLYRSGTTTIQNSKSTTAKAMGFIKIGVSSIAGFANDTIGIAQTVYSALKDSVSVLTAESTIKNIKVSYTWNVAETCSFIYIFDNNLGSYRLGARYHKVSCGVGASIPTLIINGSNAAAVVKQWSKTGYTTPINYDSTKKAVEYYNKSATYTSSVTKISISGLEGKIIQAFQMSNPQTPSEAGY